MQKARFHIATWPSKPLPIPTSVVFPAVLHERWPALVFDTQHVRGVDLPEELYLRELNTLDVESGEAVCAFVDTYGSTQWPDWAAFGYKEPVGARTSPAAKKKMAPGTAWVDLVDIMERVRLIRDATRLFAWLSPPKHSSRADLSLDSVAKQWESTVLPAPISELQAASALERIVNMGLRPVQPFIHLSTLQEPLPKMVRDIHHEQQAALATIRISWTC